jgi:heterodisulfide reductase subunit C/nitrate reductase gamma subunit
MFNSLFLTALIIFSLGLIFKVSNWFVKKIAAPGQTVTTFQRVRSAAGGILGILFSVKLIIVIKVILVDVLLQGRVFKEDVTRWLAHMLIFYGFMLLLVMHALDSVVTEMLFRNYYATVNPFFFLRDLFGAMVIVGVAMVVLRRYFFKTPRLRTGLKDHYAIIILALIMVSGIGLEGLQITSYSEFIRMVEDYAGLDDDEEIQALEAVWVDNYGVVSPNARGPFDDDLLSVGHEVHEGNCLDCHASAKWAFTGFSMAKLLKPVAVPLDRADGVTILWYIHIIACFAGLAYLPFSKMFHMFAVPISLIAGQVMDPKRSWPANILTRQMVELDACTHCGSCSLNCSAGMIYEALGNEYILPSEKMTFLKRMVAGRPPDDSQMKAIQQGVYLCTNCDRCTVRCPSGIQLKELWYAVREELLVKGPPQTALLTPFSFARGLQIQPELPADDYTRPIRNAVAKVAGQFAKLMQPDVAIPLNPQSPRECRPILKDRTFSHCFSCQSCTTVCPVVGNYDQPEQVLGLLPHQIMGCLGLDLTQMAAGAKMIWDCLTCYKCQESCPQEVEVCDLLFDLKNIAAKQGEFN